MTADLWWRHAMRTPEGDATRRFREGWERTFAPKQPAQQSYECEMCGEAVDENLRCPTWEACCEKAQAEPDLFAPGAKCLICERPNSEHDDGHCPEPESATARVRPELVEAERDLYGEALSEIRSILTEAAVPPSAFLDDHVRHCVAERDAAVKAKGEAEAKFKAWQSQGTENALRELDKANTRTAQLEAALLGVMAGGCWCGVGIGHPLMSKHSPQCEAARLALGVQ